MDSKQEVLIAAYRQLDAVVQQVVQVLAVREIAINRTGLVTLANKAGVRDLDGKRLEYKQFRDQLADAIKQDVIQFERNSNGPVVVNPMLLDFAVQEAFLAGRLRDYAKSIDAKSATQSYYFYRDPREMARMRVAFYLGDTNHWNEMLPNADYIPNVLNPFRLDVFKELPPPFQQFFAGQLVVFLTSGSRRISADDIAQLCDLVAAQNEISPELISSLRDLYVAQGNIEGLSRLAQDAAPADAVEACTLFLQGEYGRSLVEMEKSLKALRKQTKKRTAAIKYMPSMLYVLLLLRDKSTRSLKTAKSIIKRMDDWHGYGLFAYYVQTAIAGIERPDTPKVWIKAERHSLSLHYLAIGWMRRWFDSDSPPPFSREAIERVADDYRHCGLLWLAAECDALAGAAPLGQGKSEQKRCRLRAQQSAQTHAELGTVSLVDFIQPVPKWDKLLSAVETLANASGKASLDEDGLQDERLIWELDYSKNDAWLDLIPYVQKRSAKGWTKGRKVALSRLYANHTSSDFDFLTDQDQAICSTLLESHERNSYGYRDVSYDWDIDRLVQVIVGHPNIYRPGDRTAPIEISAETPGLAILQDDSSIRLAVSPDWRGERLVIDTMGKNRLAITRFDDKQMQLAKMISAMPPIPADQRERIAAVTQSISSIIPVQSDIEGNGPTGETVEPLSGVVAQLTPYQEGLRAELFVQPLGEHGPFCRPGIGSASVFATVSGKPLTTRRDLEREQANLKSLLDACGPLDSRTVSSEQHEWQFADPEDALELVTELQSLAEMGKLTILWPRGESHQVAGSATMAQFRLRVRKDRDWFAASGQLQVDDELTLDMMKLLELTSAQPSRFVQLDDGRFLALSAELRQRVDELAAYGAIGKGKVRFPPIRALAIEEFVETTEADTDQHWKAHVAKIEESATLETPVPTMLQAELRDYQREGYGWMKRLAHWNTGACLADDMGLGKTVQALALLIDRAARGPALVVAPASVGFNWENEAFKFAPTLTPKLFRDWDRDEFFRQLAASDLAITSYGLLQSEIERFAEVQWSTILLDEAQAIKNMESKRSQAVMQLQGDFRLILTGTPLENHLGEMWNLFRFMTPGLLGSHADFRERFAVPIERDECREARNRLKKLIQPFLLRRTKSEVLSELPPRSESVLEIEMSAAEVALYEAVRQRALEKFNKASAEMANGSRKGQEHLQVLAELTRLRLACCHPSLVGGAGIESSKLEMFRHKITEIVEGHHQVLVFSQFVKHLTILREELDTMGVSYQYLDGSTPARKRKEIVEAFQSGQGDVFLISLKAGGTGLNLTAADYVIHMDPWWNPAVEDQATDRAHRIGQKRPVNVYRFITKGTIEEKIVALHESKRDLADSLLSGNNVVNKLSTEDLLNLLRDA